MGQELVGLRTELNEVWFELGGVAHLRAEIANLTAALRHSQIPEVPTGDAPGPSVRVQEVDVHEHTSESPVPQDLARGEAPAISGEEEFQSRVSVHERLNLRARWTATLDPRKGMRVHITIAVPDLRQMLNERSVPQ